MINRNQVAGRAKEAGGKVQEKLGRLTGSNALRAKGLARQAIGVGQAAAGDIAAQAKRSRKGR